VLFLPVTVLIRKFIVDKRREKGFWDVDVDVLLLLVSFFKTRVNSQKRQVDGGRCICQLVELLQLNETKITKLYKPLCSTTACAGIFRV